VVRPVPESVAVELRLELEATGGTTTGFRVPDEVVEALGAGRRPKVVATVGGHTWRSSIARMGEASWLGMSRAEREAAGVAAGDVLDLVVEVDAAPRTVEVPDDLAERLAADPALAAAWAALAPSRQKEAARQLTETKRAETRARRLEKVVADLGG